MLGVERKSRVVQASRRKLGLQTTKKYERSQYVIENTGRHVQNELKRSPNEPQLSAEMRALRAEFEFSSTSQVLPGASSGKDGRAWTKSPGRGNPEECERIRKSWERSQGVLENKGHHVFEGRKYRVFCAQINSNLTPKGANDATFWENEVTTCDSQRDGITVTRSRLVKLGSSIGADLICGRVGASYRRIVAFWHTTLIPYALLG